MIQGFHSAWVIRWQCLAGAFIIHFLEPGVTKTKRQFHKLQRFCRVTGGPQRYRCRYGQSRGLRQRHLTPQSIEWNVRITSSMKEHQQILVDAIVGMLIFVFLLRFFPQNTPRSRRQLPAFIYVNWYFTMSSFSALGGIESHICHILDQTYGPRIVPLICVTTFDLQSNIRVVWIGATYRPGSTASCFVPIPPRPIVSLT